MALAYGLAKVGYASIWPLFGASNQLLSVLALLACAVFLKKTKRANVMLIIPAFVMIGVTFTALVLKIKSLIQAIIAGGDGIFGNSLQLVFAILIFGLGICVTIQGLKSYFSKKNVSMSDEDVKAA